MNVTTAAAVEAEYRSRGFNFTPDLVAIGLEHSLANSALLERRSQHDEYGTGLEEFYTTQEKVRRLAEREVKLAAQLNPPVHQVGAVLQFLMFPAAEYKFGDLPVTVRITGSHFDMVNGRVYHVVDILDPDHHIPGAHAEQLSPVHAVPDWRQKLNRNANKVHDH